jgi:hypothetical protein
MNIKTILTIFVSLACAASAFAGQRFDAATWRNVQTYDVPTLLKQEASLIGRIVAVRFHYRSEKLRHLQPSWYEASIWQHDPKGKKGFSALRVMVAKKDVPAFQTFTSDFNAMADVTVYGRVEQEPENNLTHLRLIGRKVEIDPAGNATVDW